jgi:hypothetical protein
VWCRSTMRGSGHNPPACVWLEGVAEPAAVAGLLGKERRGGGGGAMPPTIGQGAPNSERKGMGVCQQQQ